MANGPGYGSGGGGAVSNTGGTMQTPRTSTRTTTTQNTTPGANGSNVNLAQGSILPAGPPLTTQTRVTKGYFTGDTGLLTSNLIYTGSLAASNKDYYFTLTNKHPQSASVATQFAVTFGHRGGSGSKVVDSTGNKTLIGETKAIYNQFASLVLPEGEVSGGFKISAAGTSGVHYASQAADEYIYVLVAQRARFKDELDYGNWTLKLKGKLADGSDSRILELTDDSKDTSYTTTNSIYGRKFNVVSGSTGTLANNATAAVRTFGFYYPEAGFMVLSGTELSASIPGHTNIVNMTASFDADNTNLTFATSSLGFGPNLDDNDNSKNALKLLNCMRQAGTEEQRFRSAQIQNKKSYFLTVPPQACNFSTNPTFVSGSDSKLRHKSMYGNPNVFITTVGLHRSDGRLVAVAKLSTPIIKNFGVQTTIKVNLTY